MDKDKYNQEIGNRIRSMRKMQDLTLQDLADKIGVSMATVQKYEKGEISNVSLSIIQDFATALHVEPTFLLGFAKETPKQKEETPEMILLYQASRNLTHEDIKETLQFMDYLKSKHKH